MCPQCQIIVEHNGSCNKFPTVSLCLSCGRVEVEYFNQPGRTLQLVFLKCLVQVLQDAKWVAKYLNLETFRTFHLFAIWGKLVFSSWIMRVPSIRRVRPRRELYWQSLMALLFYLCVIKRELVLGETEEENGEEAKIAKCVDDWCWMIMIHCEMRIILVTPLPSHTPHCDKDFVTRTRCWLLFFSVI